MFEGHDTVSNTMAFLVSSLDNVWNFWLLDDNGRTQTSHPRKNLQWTQGNFW
jgi:hypothetical protein